jgi:hypothetical protein
MASFDDDGYWAVASRPRKEIIIAFRALLKKPKFV